MRLLGKLLLAPLAMLAYFFSTLGLLLVALADYLDEFIYNRS